MYIADHCVTSTACGFTTVNTPECRTDPQAIIRPYFFTPEKTEAKHYVYVAEERSTIRFNWVALFSLYCQYIMHFIEHFIAHS
jgi:hypothetical protein